MVCRGLENLNVARLLTNVGRLAEFCGFVPVLDSQTPRLPRRIFHHARASLVKTLAKVAREPRLEPNLLAEARLFSELLLLNVDVVA